MKKAPRVVPGASWFLLLVSSSGFLKPGKSLTSAMSFNGIIYSLQVIVNSQRGQ
jgi:hypothetical protein